MSDSRPQIARYDTPDYSDEIKNYANDELDSAGLDEESLFDGASSNMNEKKVVRELTKILSKGMSGATDQVRVETLENLKRRQKERKALKDNRAKLFEEILTTAINSHPDKLKKGKGGTLKAKNIGLKSSASSSPSSSSSGSVSGSISPYLDSDLGADAETVLQHLQSLSSGNYDGGYSSDALSPTPTMSEGEPDDSSSNLSEPSNEPSSYEATERPKKSQASASSSDRPIVRQFKKIKNQISQRRKQLDQIKKLFNIELALKDGSLVGKQVAQQQNSPSGSKKKPKAASAATAAHAYSPMEPVDQSEDFSEDPEAFMGKRSRTPSAPVRSEKARELLTYLRDNPEILASVMAELTVDADPSPGSGGRSQSVMSRAEDSTSYHQHHHHQHHNQDQDEMSLGSLKNKRLAARYNPTIQQQLSQQQQQLLMMDQDEMAGMPAVVRSKRARRTSADRSVKIVNDYDPLLMTMRRNRASDSTTYMSAPIHTARLSISKGRPTAEELLLESLRERQLLNLARLDLVLAERSASNKTMSSLNALQPMPDSLMTKQANFNQYDQLESIRRSTNDDAGRALSSNNSSFTMSKLPTNRSEQDLTHHFLAISQANGNDHLAKQLNDNLNLNSVSGGGGGDGNGGGAFPMQVQPQQHLPLQQQQQIFQKQNAHNTVPNIRQTQMMMSGAGLGSGAGNFSIGPQQQLQQPYQSSNPYQLRAPDNHSQQPVSSLSPPLSPSPGGTLNRFSNWRDVSQEASSWRYNRASSPLGMNVSLSPYDLNTGSTFASSMGIESRAKLPAIAQSPQANIDTSSNNNNNLIEPLNNNQPPNQELPPTSLLGNGERLPTNQLKVGGGGSGIGQTKEAGGIHLGPNQQQRDFSDQPSLASPAPYGKQPNPANPLQTTRASQAEPDLSTVKLTNFDDRDKERLPHTNRKSASNHHNRAASLRDDTSANNARGHEDHYHSSRHGAEDDEDDEMSERGDYFRSYKDEEQPINRRSKKVRFVNHHARRHQEALYQPSDMDSSDQEIDDSGAMWA